MLNAVVGFAGVHATLWALEHGVDLALANKESLVAAGELALAARERGGGRILPVDSEHSALFQCLEGREPEQIDTLVLTGSGGPFRGRTRAELEDVTPDQALAHPTWRMGPKITVDSATLANKGLEVIEAHYLFGVPYERIEVAIQPTSIVHSLVRFRDGAALAHLGYPDMRVPISYALTYPERAATPLAPLDLTVAHARVLAARHGHVPDARARARAAGEEGGSAPCVYNAANEVAVAAFLAGRLPFLGIPEVVGETLAAAGTDAGRAISTTSSRPTARARATRRRSAGRRMTWLVVIGGLVLLVFLHELGHFCVAPRGRDAAAELLRRLPAGARQGRRNGIEYGIGMIPLGGLVRIPGMHRPAARDLRALTRARRARAAEPRAGRRRASGARSTRRTTTRPGRRIPSSSASSAPRTLSPGARRSAERGLRDVEEGTAPEAYWRAADLEARRRHRRRAARERRRSRS